MMTNQASQDDHFDGHDVSPRTTHHSLRYKYQIPRHDARVALDGGSAKFKPFRPAVDAYVMAGQSPEVEEYHGEGMSIPPEVYTAHLRKLGVKGELGADNITPTFGATQGFHEAVNLLGKDDVLLVQTPGYGYFKYPEHLEHTNVVSLQLRKEDGYKLTPDYLDQEITRINAALQKRGKNKISAFFNINPGNPLGTVYTQDEVQKLARVIEKHGLRMVIDDMAYSGLEFDHNHPDKQDRRIAAPFAGELPDKTITLLSLSKSFGLPRYRAGLMVGPAHFIVPVQKKLYRRLDDHALAPEAAFAAAVAPGNEAALNSYRKEQAAYFEFRHHLVRLMVNGWDKDEASRDFFARNNIDSVEALAEKVECRPELKEKLKSLLAFGIPGLVMLPVTEAGFFATIDATRLKGKAFGAHTINSAMDLVEAMPMRGNVITLAGEAMGNHDGNLLLRLTYTDSMDNIIEGIAGMREALRRVDVISADSLSHFESVTGAAPVHPREKLLAEKFGPGRLDTHPSR